MTTIILNSKNRFDLQNTTPNNCEYLFDWSSLNEGRYKMNYSICKYNLPIFLSELQQLLIDKKPWAKYSSNLVGNLLLDETTNGRDAVCQNMTKVTSSVVGGIPCVSGNATTVGGLGSIIFPEGSIPVSYSICALTRYSGLNRRRILTSFAFSNYVLGNYGTGGGGIGYYDQGFAYNSAMTLAEQSKWHSLICVRGNTIPNNIMYDGTAVGTANISGVNTVNRLSINNNQFNEFSDFELAQVIIFDSSLTPAQMTIISTSFNNYKTTGILI